MSNIKGQAYQHPILINIGICYKTMKNKYNNLLTNSINFELQNHMNADNKNNDTTNPCTYLIQM